MSQDVRASPAKDTQTALTTDMERIFAGVYGVKRFAPGEITAFWQDRGLLTHDCTTLPGNSGSVVLRVDTGEALGLHFGGIEKKLTTPSART